MASTERYRHSELCPWNAHSEDPIHIRLEDDVHGAAMDMSDTVEDTEPAQRIGTGGYLYTLPQESGTYAPTVAVVDICEAARAIIRPGQRRPAVNNHTCWCQILDGIPA